MSCTKFSSTYIGIHWDSSRYKWFAKIHINGTSLFLGRFKDFDDAVEAIEKAEAAISLLRSMDAVDIYISNKRNSDKTISGIVSEKSFNFKVGIQLDLVRTRDLSTVGGEA